MLIDNVEEKHSLTQWHYAGQALDDAVHVTGIPHIF